MSALRNEPFIDPEVQYECDPTGRRFAYLETVVHHGGEPSGFYVTDDHAAGLVRRGVTKYKIKPDVERDGTITLIRTRWAGKPSITITLKPTVRTAGITATMADDLKALTDHHGNAKVRGERIVAGLYSIPPAAARRLYARGLLEFTDEEDAPATVTLAGRIALVLHEHQTSTTTPLGWHAPGEGLPGDPRTIPTTRQDRRHPGMVPTYSSTAYCTCRWSEFCERRQIAQWRANAHRERALAAALVAFAVR